MKHSNMSIINADQSGATVIRSIQEFLKEINNQRIRKYSNKSQQKLSKIVNTPLTVPKKI